MTQKMCFKVKLDILYVQIVNCTSIKNDSFLFDYEIACLKNTNKYLKAIKMNNRNKNCTYDIN